MQFWRQLVELSAEHGQWCLAREQGGRACQRQFRDRGAELREAGGRDVAAFAAAQRWHDFVGEDAVEYELEYYAPKNLMERADKLSACNTPIFCGSRLCQRNNVQEGPHR